MNETDNDNLRRIRESEAENTALLISLTSMYYLFGKVNKAFHIVELAQHFEPENQSVLELKTVLLGELKRYDEALEMIGSLEQSSVPLASEIRSLKRRAMRTIKL